MEELLHHEAMFTDAPLRVGVRVVGEPQQDVAVLVDPSTALPRAVGGTGSPLRRKPRVLDGNANPPDGERDTRGARPESVSDGLKRQPRPIEPHGFLAPLVRPRQISSRPRTESTMVLDGGERDLVLRRKFCQREFVGNVVALQLLNLRRGETRRCAAPPAELRGVVHDGLWRVAGPPRDFLCRMPFAPQLLGKRQYVGVRGGQIGPPPLWHLANI